MKKVLLLETLELLVENIMYLRFFNLFLKKNLTRLACYTKYY